MKAVRIHSYGDADLLKFEDVPRPDVPSDHVLVEIRDAGVNPIDWKIRSGMMKDWMPATFPLTMGQDFSGDVVQVGKDISRFSVGDRVFGFAKGSYAEYASIPEGQLAKLPSSVNFEMGASLPTAGLTAYQIIVKVAHASPGKTLLIHGAAGGVGAIATQIARSMGATVIATASGKDATYLKEMGVSRVIDYKRERFEDLAKDVDVVVDLIGGETQVRSFPILKKGGILITTVGLEDQNSSASHGVQAVEFGMEQNAFDLEQLAKLVDQGVVKPRVSRVVPIREAKKAQELNETGMSHGKVVLKVA